MTAQRNHLDQPSTLWDRMPPAVRGRSSLSADEIAGVAIAIADAESLSAASVKRVAHRLAVSAARLEQYLVDRDDLYDLMLDVCLGQVVLPDSGSDWRTQWEAIARETYRIASGHRCLVDLIAGRSPSGPNGLRYVEHALAAMASAEVDVRAAALSFNSLLWFVCGAANAQLRRGQSSSAHRLRAEGEAQYLTEVAATDRYPQVSALLAQAADLSADESFDHGLTSLLDGFAMRISRPLDAAVGS